MTAAGTWHDVASLADLSDEEGLGVAAGGQRLALFRDRGQIHAVERSCPHQGADLAEGLVRDGLLTCPLHVWQFRLCDGVNIDAGPGLKTFPVRVEGNRITILA